MLQKIKDLFINTKIELYLFSAIGFGLVFLFTYIHEWENSKSIPIAFSEIERIEEICKKESINVPVITRYLSSTFDYNNKVFECYNESQGLLLLGDNTKSFASELDYRMDSTLKVHKYELYDLDFIIQDYSDSLNVYFKKYIEVMNNSRYVTNVANSTWNYRTVDHYHTEIRSYTTSDGKGHTTTHYYTVQVYDNTDHYFTYHPDQGEELDQTNFKFINSYDNFFYDEALVVADRVGANNEYAMEKSRKNKIDSSLTEEQFLKLSQGWAWNSFYPPYNGRIHGLWGEYKSTQPEWTVDKLNSRSVSYRTTSRTDAGPKGYRTVRHISSVSQNLSSTIWDMLAIIQQTKVDIIQLDNLIKKYVNVTLNKEEGDAGDLKDQILQLNKKIYESNFIGQEKIQMFSWWFVILLSLAGGLIGLGVGIYVDYKIDEIHNRTQSNNNNYTPPTFNSTSFRRPSPYGRTRKRY